MTKRSHGQKTKGNQENDYKQNENINKETKLIKKGTKQILELEVQ